MIDRLPIEIQRELLLLDPGSSLKHINSHFYILYNDLFYDKIVAGIGSKGITILISVLDEIRTYIRSLDSFRRESRTLILSRLNLPSLTIVPGKTSNANSCVLDRTVSNGGIPTELNCIYIRDSWRYVYALFKNKRFHAQYTDYKIDEPTNYIYNHFVEINRTYLLSFEKTFWLLPGVYNLTIGLVVKHGKGLGTTKFEVGLELNHPQHFVQTFYPPTNINEILPKNKFCLLKVGDFEVPQKDQDDAITDGNQLQKVRLVMEEIGLYLKSGFRIFFIDVCEPSRLFNQFGLLFYTVEATDYRFFINLPLKLFYSALANSEGDDTYGSGLDSNDDEDNRMVELQEDNESIFNSFMVSSEENTGDDPESALVAIRYRNSYEPGFSPLEHYSNFYYNNSHIQRYFKFSTIYKHRQFVNRYGDFTLDWNGNGEGNNEHEIVDNHQSRCVYDRYNVKWKMPILGDL